MSDFAEFWAAYPRKVGKLAAERKWRQLTPNLSQVLAAIAQQRQSAQWQDPQFIPHPATWLNQGRWLDEATAAERVRFPDCWPCRHEPRCTSARMHTNALLMGRPG